MSPLHAPLPTARYLPFQPGPGPEPCAELAGSQTSILMSESLDGFAVNATRQKAARLPNGFPPRPARPPGWVNAPAATICAVSTVACGSVSVARLSHVAACAYGATSVIPSTRPEIRAASSEARASSPEQRAPR